MAGEPNITDGLQKELIRDRLQSALDAAAKGDEAPLIAWAKRYAMPLADEAIHLHGFSRRTW